MASFVAVERRAPGARRGNNGDGIQRTAHPRALSHMLGLLSMTGRVGSRGRVILDKPSLPRASATQPEASLAYLTALAPVSTEQEVLDVISDLALDAFGATAAEIALLNFRLELEIAGRMNLAGNIGHADIVSLDDPDQLSRAVRTGEPVWQPDGAPAPFHSSCVLPLRTKDRILGGIALWFAEPHTFDDAERSMLVQTAENTGGVLDRARLFSSEQRVRMRAEGAADRLARLQSVTAGLSGAHSSGDVADVVVGQAVSELRASSGALLMLDGEGVLRLVRQMNADLWRDTPLDEMLPIAEAARTKRLVLLSSAEQRVARYPSTGDMPAGHRSLAAVPLVLKGNTLGVVALTFPDNREFGKEETTFLSSLGLQCAQALERAHLYEAERRAHTIAERGRVLSSVLAEASSALAASMEPERALPEVVRLLVPDVVHACAVHMIGDASPELVAFAHARHDIAPVFAAALSDAPAAERLYLAAGNGGGVPSPRMTDAAALGLDDRFDVSGAAVVRLRGRHKVYGVMSVFGAPLSEGLTTEDVAWARELSARIGIALDNAHLYRQRAEEARVLQQHLVPAQPSSAGGLQIAARYRPFGDGTMVGGDFFDVFPIRPGCFGIVMGDVSGKGVAAASVTAIARYTIRAVASHGSPRDALRTLNEIMLEERLDDRFCTVVHAHVDVEPEGARMTLACGGHPHPLLVRPDGEVRPLGIPGTAIGLLPDPTVHDTEIKLEPGDAVLFYTDGVIEARDAAGAVFEPELSRVARENAGRPAETIARAIERELRAFQQGASRDDMGLLVMRIPDQESG